MGYTKKFQKLADNAIENVEFVLPEDDDRLVNMEAILLDIRDKEEHEVDHISSSVHLSRGKREMNIEELIPDLHKTILCYCNANNRGALSAYSLKNMGYRNVRFIKWGLKAYRSL